MVIAGAGVGTAAKLCQVGTVLLLKKLGRETGVETGDVQLGKMSHR